MAGHRPLVVVTGSGTVRKLVGEALRLDVIATPPTPPAGAVDVYGKAGSLYWIGADGIEHLVGAAGDIAAVTAAYIAADAVVTAAYTAADAAHVAAGDPHGGYQKESEKGAALGYAGLDASSFIPTANIPPLAISETFVVASQAAMLALTAQRGDVAIRTDLSRAFILSTDSPSTLADWKELLTPADAVTSVFGRTGVVAAADADYTAGQVVVTPTGGISSTRVQAALAELDTEKANVASAVMDGDTAGGALSGTYPSPGFAATVGVHVYRSTLQTLGSGSVIAGDFDTEVFDSHTFWTAGANSNKLIVPTGQAGWYDVMFQCGFASAATNRLIEIYVNGASLTPRIVEFVSYAGSSPLFRVTGHVLLAAGDYVQMGLYQDSGGNVNATAAVMVAQMFRRPSA